MSTPGEKLILKLLSQSVENVNKACRLSADLDGREFNYYNTNAYCNDKVGDGNENNFMEKSEEPKTNIKKIANGEPQNQLEDTPYHVFIDNSTNKNKIKSRKLRKYSKNAKRKPFTQAEIDIILMAMKKDGDNVNYKEIGKELGRDKLTVQTKIQLLKAGSLPRRSWTLTEDKIIMDAYLYKLVSKQKFMFMGNISMPELLQLSLNLKRVHPSIHGRWKKHIQPWILQYYSGTLNLQVVPMLTHFLAANFSGIDTIDWSVVVSKPEFAGHTESSLKNLLHNNMKNLKTSSEVDEVDLSRVNQFTDQKLKEGKFRQVSTRTETRQMDVVRYFQEYVAKNKITDVFD